MIVKFLIDKLNTNLNLYATLKDLIAYKAFTRFVNFGIKLINLVYPM